MRRRHAVITRFAVRWPGPTSHVSPRPLSAAWVAKRLQLFERYCVPSLQAQTLTAFRWIVHVHPEIDPAVVDQLRRADKRIEVTAAPVGTVPRVPVGELLVTTRVDSDDALAATLLERADAEVKTWAEATPGATGRTWLVTFERGWYCDDATGRIYLSRGASFRSLAAKPDEHGRAPTVYAKNCDVISRSFPGVTVTDPLWVRVVHGSNLTNRFGGVPTHALPSLAGPLYPWLARAEVTA